MRQLKITKQVTSREAASLDKYLHEISKIDMVTAEEEVVLAQRIRQGDMSALKTLTKANLRFVVSVSKQYQNQGLSLPDLINEGNLGLIKAALRFDETRGFKFISYAVWWIRQSIMQAIAEQSRIVRLPLNKIGILNKLNKAAAVLEQRLDRQPDNAELARELNISLRDVKDVLQNSGRHISVDAPIDDDQQDTMLDMMHGDESSSPEKGVFLESLRSEIEHLISVLSYREANILRFYFGLDGLHPMTLGEIGEKLNLTRERVRQIKEKAIRHLKQSSGCHCLKTYLG